MRLVPFIAFLCYNRFQECGRWVFFYGCWVFRSVSKIALGIEQAVCRYESFRANVLKLGDAKLYVMNLDEEKCSSVQV